MAALTRNLSPTDLDHDDNKAPTAQAGKPCNDSTHELGCGSTLRRAFLGWQVSTSLASAAVLDELASTSPAQLPTTNDNKDKALTVQAGEQYAKNVYELGCGSSPQRASLGWHACEESLASAAVLVELASTHSVRLLVAHVNNTDNASIAHADRHHAKGCGSSLRHAFLGWRVCTSLASAAALVELASIQSAYVRIWAYRSPNLVTF